MVRPNGGKTVRYFTHGAWCGQGRIPPQNLIPPTVREGRAWRTAASGPDMTGPLLPLDLSVCDVFHLATSITFHRSLVRIASTV